VNINKENNSLNKNIVYDLTPFTHLDYPNHLACIIWLVGCNMRCDYCYNKEIVFSKNGTQSLNEIILFLKTRVGLLDAIVLSGGEATNHELVSFCRKVKHLGFKIKLDTNGLNFQNIKELVDLELIDFIALDYKAPHCKFKQITHTNNFKSFEDTLNYLINKQITFEVRTTIHNDLLDENDINFIIDDLVYKGYKDNYYLQSFLDTEDNIANIKQSFKSFEKSKISTKLNIIYR
jgi:pyruvate formate lyase activating enzyme